MLESDRFVGGNEVKADRAKGWMRVTGFWPEPKVQWTAARQNKLERELARFARLARVQDVEWQVARPI